jgi:membrane protease subunit HflK
VGDAGLRWHLPPPLETHEIVNVNEVVREEFGVLDKAAGTAADEARAEATMQSSDNNIVELGFVVQYVVKDAFAARYRLAEPRATLRDAAQAAVREVVGRMTIDDVLSKQRGQVSAGHWERGRSSTTTTPA